MGLGLGVGLELEGGWRQDKNTSEETGKTMVKKGTEWGCGQRVIGQWSWGWV